MTSKIQFKYLTLTMALGLSVAFLLYSCKKTETKTPPPVTTSLTTAIDSAKWYLANTKEGTQPAEYTKGTQAALQAALAAGQAVLANSASTQAQITAAAANLNAAVTAYKAGLITPIAAASLVAYWKFNGNANDSSGNGHNGTLEAGPVGLAAVPGAAPNLVIDRFGIANSSYHFTGGGNIDVPYSPNLNPTGAMSISLWERQDTAGRTDHRADCYMLGLNRWNGYKFQMQPTKPFFTVRTDTSVYDRDGVVELVIGTTTGAGPWHHLVATYDGDSTEVFYVDNIAVKTWTNIRGAIKVFSPTVDLSIGSDLPNSAYTPTDDGTGRYFISWGGYWTGDLDDIMIYNVALSGTQVTQIYNQQVTQ